MALSPQGQYTEREAAAGQRSYCQLFPLKGIEIFIITVISSIDKLVNISKDFHIVLCIFYENLHTA